MTDQELIIWAVREAQLVLAGYIEPGPRDAEATINRLMSILDSNDLVAAVDRIEGELGLRLPIEGHFPLIQPHGGAMLCSARAGIRPGQLTICKNDIGLLLHTA